MKVLILSQILRVFYLTRTMYDNTGKKKTKLHIFLCHVSRNTTDMAILIILKLEKQFLRNSVLHYEEFSKLGAPIIEC
jgi:hypothetical protein